MDNNTSTLTLLHTPHKYKKCRIPKIVEYSIYVYMHNLNIASYLRTNIVVLKMYKRKRNRISTGLWSIALIYFTKKKKITQKMESIESATP